MLTPVCVVFQLYCRRAIVQNSQWQLDPTVNTQIQDGAIKPRMHPGRTAIKNLQMPAKLLDAIDIITESTYQHFVCGFVD